MKGWGVCLLAWLLCWAGLPAMEARAGEAVKIYTFSAEEIPQELSQTAMQVNTQEVRITLTFAGDCTLGGTPSTVNASRGFGGVVREKGMDYPFAKLRGLFATDDCTVVNLEGVLSQEKEGTVPGKRFHFIGDPGYGEILSRGSVECVNLANNHTMDFGRRGYEDTMAALQKAQVAYFGEDTVTVVEKGGMRIGLTGSLVALGEDKRRVLERQMEALREAGCQWIAHSMHGGVEYAQQPTPRQRGTAAYAAGAGAALVVGHHPHVVQGMEMLGDVPVLYSLGNCSFGGNFRPRDMDACLLRVELAFAQGELQSMELALWPIRVSGETGSNNFQPVLAAGEDAARIMEKLQKSSKIQLAPYEEGKGAVLPAVEYKAQKER